MWFFTHTSCTSQARLDGKTVVITGANAGIGKETARDFYGRGARVILACRNLEKAQAALEDIKNKPVSGAEYQKDVGELAIYHLDLCSFKSVKECAENLLKHEEAIHILVNNAGVAIPAGKKSEDGFGITLQTNYLGHFLFTILLLPKIQASSPDCRIVNVSSITYCFSSIDFDDMKFENSTSYNPLQSYGQSKLAQILFTRELARRLKQANIRGINVYSLHPGYIRTGIEQHYNDKLYWYWRAFYRLITRPFLKSVEQGAQTTIYCSVDEQAGTETGLYYEECKVVDPWSHAKNDKMAKDLWNYTCQLLHLEPHEDFSTFLKGVSNKIKY